MVLNENKKSEEMAVLIPFLAEVRFCHVHNLHGIRMKLGRNLN